MSDELSPLWHPPETAPKDGNPFLGDFGYPWPLPALWDEHGEAWTYATVQACPMTDGTINSYFENESEPFAALKRWRPMPPLTIADPS